MQSCSLVCISVVVCLSELAAFFLSSFFLVLLYFHVIIALLWFDLFQGMIADDDPIYLSLGEIPLSMSGI